MKIQVLLSLYLLLSSAAIGFSQQTYTLEECIAIALQNSGELKQSNLSAKSEKLNLEMQRARQVPSLSANTNLALQLGRSIDPTTNDFTTNQFLYQNYGIQSNVTLFNWSSVKNSIKASKLEYEATIQDAKETILEVEISTISAFLTLLNAQKQAQIAIESIALTNKQIVIADSLIIYGKVTKISVINLKTQLSKDSSAFYKALHLIKRSKLELATLLNDTSNSLSFEISDSLNISYDSIFLQLGSYPILDLLQKAENEHPSITADNSELESLKYRIKVSQSLKKPSVALGANINTIYSNAFGKSYGRQVSYFDQLFNVNLNRSVYLSVSIPIFNQKVNNTNIQQAKINYQVKVNQRSQKLLEIRKVIYSAYNDAVFSLEQYRQSVNGVKYAEEGFMLNKLLFENGKITINELIDSLNILTSNKVSSTIFLYEAIFKAHTLKLYERM